MTKFYKFIVPLIVVICISCFAIIVFGNHRLTTELVDEISVEELNVSINSDCFFIKSDEYDNFYDGFDKLKQLVPNYNIQSLNTDQYTYVVAIDGTVSTVNYSAKNCKKRTAIGLPITYTAFLDYKNTNDNVVRIYKIKKVNVDYDYHSGRTVEYPTY